ncbi:MAG: phytanoyl-CoA dioxygenase family protein [Actinobacteria bacterium]|nr:phytanoyl-CoA dioxygenase family protein [Actinomycetota bacterium]
MTKAKPAQSAASSDGSARRLGDEYIVSADELARFKRDGYVHLRGVMSESEMKVIDDAYDAFLDRRISVEGRDFNDMTTGEFGTDPANYAIVNVMLPRKYLPSLQGNLFERRAASIAKQLCGDGMVIDFDQLLAKQPFRNDAVFAWHQDQAYWIDTPDRRTATCWLAVDDSNLANGCMQFLPGSQNEPVRPHRPLHGDRDTSHTLVTDLRPGEITTPAQISRGDITVHCEGVLHGSGGNTSASRRRAYIVAFRSSDTVAKERSLGFTHSHNDEKGVKDSVDGLQA